MLNNPTVQSSVVYEESFYILCEIKYCIIKSGYWWSYHTYCFALEKTTANGVFISFFCSFSSKNISRACLGLVYM